MGGYAALLLLQRKYPFVIVRRIGLIHSHCFEDSEAKKGESKKSQSILSIDMGASAFLTPFYTQLFAAENFAKHKHLIADLTRRNARLSAKAIIAGAEALILRPSFEKP
jgi:hypothetical protein